MESIRCKFCEGSVQAKEGEVYGDCDSCGSTVKLPNVTKKKESESKEKESSNVKGKKFEYVLEEALYHWTSFPFIDKPKHSVALCLIIILITYILWELAVGIWQQPLYYVLGVFMLFIGIVPYFVPTRYYFFEKGLVVIYPIAKVEKLYSDYGCFYADKNGIMLSTFKRPRRLDAFRGQSIRFSKTKEEREAIIELLKDKEMKRF
jgi:hypothetical protein